MDLEYGPEYEAFRAQVRKFLDEHKKSAPSTGIGSSGGVSGARQTVEMPPRPICSSRR